LHFHDFVIVVLVGIIVFVGVAIGGALISPHINTGLLEGQVLECVWTILPAIILVQIAAPSLILLYLLEERVERGLTVKALGHQWY
jgi:cytochrome c oxidase subunit 2